LVPALIDLFKVGQDVRVIVEKPFHTNKLASLFDIVNFLP